MSEDNAVYLLRGSKWYRISAAGPSPQYLSEMTSLAFDTKRNQLILHGGGPRRRELWIFDVKTRKWVASKRLAWISTDNNSPKV
jgi:hypothetical protein